MTYFVWQSTPLIWALIFVLGSCVGSLINVVAYRLPIMSQPDTDTRCFNLAYPPSRCPSCARDIKPWQNVPIIGYLWLQGRTRCCDKPIAAHYLLTELITGAISVVVFAYLTSAVEPLAHDNAAFFKTLAGTFALFWWLIAIVATGRQHASNVRSLWQSCIWLGLLANLDGQYCPLPEAVGLVCTAHALGMLSLHWVTQQQDRSRLFFLGLAAGLAWFGSAFLLPLALTILGAGTVRLGATIGRFANNETSAELKLRTDQNVVATAIALSWFLSVWRT